MRPMGPPGETHAEIPERYSRQVLFENLGLEGQRRLMNSRVTLIGCGALGSAIAETLVRAGVGFLRLCDRDYLELNNLQRQTLFDEQDVASNLPKAEAARIKLERINSEVTIEAAVTHVDPLNVESYAAGADLLLDGTDNFETRYLLNDTAVKLGLPWVYGGVIGATGSCLAVVPGRTPCLRCAFESPPTPEVTPTCDTVGVLAPAVAIVAALQCVAAFKILTDQVDETIGRLISMDLWTWQIANVSACDTRGHCPCCQLRRFDYLEGRSMTSTTVLCGKNAVQVNRHEGLRIDLAAIAERLARVAEGPVTRNRFLLKAQLEGHELTLFSDGRAIINGTSDSDRARTIYARYLGN